MRRALVGGQSVAPLLLLSRESLGRQPLKEIVLVTAAGAKLLGARRRVGEALVRSAGAAHAPENSHGLALTPGRRSTWTKLIFEEKLTRLFAHHNATRVSALCASLGAKNDVF